MFATDQSYPGAAGQAGGHNELIPLVNAVAGVGVNVVYTIVGYAEFFITGWNFSGNSYSGSAGSPPCSGSDRCIAGYFVRYLDRSAAPGSGTTSYGAASSRLAG